MDPITVGLQVAQLAAVFVAFRMGVHYGTVSAERDHLQAKLEAKSRAVDAGVRAAEDYHTGLDAIPDSNGLRVLFPSEDEARAEFTATPEPPERTETVGTPSDSGKGPRRSQRLLSVSGDA